MLKHYTTLIWGKLPQGRGRLEPSLEAAAAEQLLQVT